MSTAEIVQSVFDREKARQAKDFVTADALRKELSDSGVTLWDKKNNWTATDGRTGPIPSFDQVQSGEVPSVDSQMQDGSDEAAHIRHQVQLREQARASKKFEESDRIRDELKGIGVEVYDKEKFWKQESTGLQGCVLGYGQTGKGPTDLEIQTLIIQREKAREGKDFPKSDIIRDELKAHGVIILDKEKIWKAKDGRSGPVPSFDVARSGTAMVGKVGAPAAKLAIGGVDLGQTILNAAVLGQQNPLVAQQTLQLLAQIASGTGGGTAAARQLTGVAQTQSAASTSQPGNLNQAIQFMRQCKQMGRACSDEEIVWLISTRERLRYTKDFHGSDNMREAMKTDVNVTLYEKEKRWQCSDGRGGAIPTWSQLGIDK